MIKSEEEKTIILKSKQQSFSNYKSLKYEFES